MANHNKRIVFVNENRITLLGDLIPKDVTMFEYERKEDGRIVLTPFSKVSNLSSDLKRIGHERNDFQKRGKVIDFQSAKANRKHRSGKKRMKAFQDGSEECLGNGEKFVGLHLFPSRLEAEMMGEILRQSEIPFLIQSEDIGIFGPSAAPAPGGARMVVRKADLDIAKDLLAGLI
ncbi:hypothetical protein JYT87_03500 [Nitrospira defluvii]|nr:hypothetical protein [Nitrospira defluvii]